MPATHETPHPCNDVAQSAACATASPLAAPWLGIEAPEACVHALAPAKPPTVSVGRINARHRHEAIEALD
ncbi:hypothetical protein, partial [Paraburkholderia sp. SIMBA_030]|uniref:hypothetical protein n=1 Tax=Paraburkholderia sp. SIMBA_030 TaxID=3085773 RepID=UPI00397C277C